MKKIYIAMMAFLSLQSVLAQETPDKPSVEKSLFNAQIGAIGIYASNEARLSDRWALRTEVGLDMWFYETYTSFNHDKGAFFAPSISIEPRWYYNLKKRAEKGKHIENNSANFVTVGVKYYPDLFKIGGPDNLYIPNQLSVIPKWGIRRAIANSNFNYELGIGIGYRWYLDDIYVYSGADEVALDIHVRLGYTF